MRVSIMARYFGLFMKYTIRMLFFIEALACAHEVQQLPTARCLQAPAQPYDTCLAFGTVKGAFAQNPLSEGPATARRRSELANRRPR